jgi:tetratricopeptide (TPR) repeat protein
MVISADKKQQFLEKNQEKFNLLLTHLSFVKGFNLSIIEFDFKRDLEMIINTITNHPKTANIQFWILNLDDPELRFFRDEMVKRLADFTIEADKKLVILVKGLENAIGIQDQQSPFLADLNYIRDLLPRDIPYPIIFCLPTYAVDRLGKFAPDVWSWLSVFTFEKIETPDTQQRNLTTYNLTQFEEEIPADNQDRIDFLSNRLAEYYQSKDDSVKELFYLLSQLGIAYRQQKDLTKAEDYLQKAEGLLKENQSLIHQSDQANLYDNFGKVYQNNLNKAIYYYQLSLDIFRKIGDIHGVENSLNNLGNAYNNLGEYQKAIDIFKQSLNIAREISDRRFEGISLSNLGLTYYYLTDYEKAIDFLQNSLHIAKETEYPLREGISLGNLGIAYQSLGEYENALKYIQEALEIVSKIGNRHAEAEFLKNLAEIYQKLGNLDLAIKYCDQALNLAKELGIPLVKECEELKQKLLKST